MDPFGELRPLEVRSFAGPAIDVNVAPGTCLVREGERSGTFYVIRSGTAELQRSGQRPRTLTTGDCFGEIDPAMPCPQAQTVVASTPLRVTTFSAYGIDELCTAIPHARDRIRSALA